MTILSSKDNSNIKNAVKLRKSAKYRRESGLFIAEGVRICMDAMLSKACIDTFFASEKSSEKYADDFLKLQNIPTKHSLYLIRYLIRCVIQSRLKDFCV